ncbi:MAG: hypothetical protein IJJ65_01640 [Butyrivibrio sp.]|nr:hypothetical protein [Butyrivibrio sp.]
MVTFLVIVYIIYRLWEEQSWNTHAYDGKRFDVDKSYADSTKVLLGQMSKAEYKRNYKNGKYAK